MGRQITVDLADLSDAGCVFRVNRDATGGDYRWLSVKIGDHWVSSDAMDCLVFDCRNRLTSPYGWVEDWLIEGRVPYLEG